MNAEAGPWIGFAFVIGLTAIVALTGALGLHRRDGVRHQRRNVYGIAIATFFLAGVLVMTELEVDVRWSAAFIAQAMIFAAVVAAFAIRWTRAEYAKSVVNGVFVRRKPSVKTFFLVYFAAFAVVPGGTELLTPVLWPYVLGSTLAFLFLTVLTYRHVAQLERDLGRPLMEGPAPQPSKP
jgi:hypothetical protein